VSQGAVFKCVCAGVNMHETLDDPNTQVGWTDIGVWEMNALARVWGFGV